MYIAIPENVQNFAAIEHGFNISCQWQSSSRANFVFYLFTQRSRLLIFKGDAYILSYDYLYL